MGFFSKVFKSVKNTFKKIGKTIKSAVASVGKFMNKLGIVGQIGLGLLLPGIGNFLGTWAGTAMASSNALIAGAGQFVNAAVNIGTKIGSAFQTVTEGVTKVIGQTVGATLNKIPGMDKLVSSLSGGKIDISNMTFKTAFETAGQAVTDIASAGSNLFSMDTLTGTNKFAQKVIDDAMTNMTKATTITDIQVPELDVSGVVPEDAGLTGVATEAGTVSIEEIGRTTMDVGTPTIKPTFTTPTIPEDAGLFSAPPVGTTAVEELVVEPSLLDRTVTAITEAPGKLYEAGVAEVEQFMADPLAGTAERVQSGIETKALQALGLEDKPEFVKNEYGTYVPSLSMEPANIRMAQAPMFDPRAYESNQDFFALNPYGYSAAQYNDYQNYLNKVA
jgi:hypothetical protein